MLFTWQLCVCFSVVVTNALFHGYVLLVMTIAVYCVLALFSLSPFLFFWSNS